ncbi:MAG TPA: alpha-amylase family glycosyl hydrolase [Chthoniobacteraceae bacterium]|nr:alpha-amylase family glycosyl hydrolase [Chthoniobacteraceae bacterium]
MNGSDISCSDGASLQITPEEGRLRVEYTAQGIDQPGRRMYLATGANGQPGSALLPYGNGLEGSTVFLPFNASRLYVIANSPGGLTASVREWKGVQWSGWSDASAAVTGTFSKDHCSLAVAEDAVCIAPRVALEIYAKDLTQNHGWGRLYGASDPAYRAGVGDQAIPGFVQLTLAGALHAVSPISPEYRTRLEADSRVRIYQLFVRLFGNINGTRKTNGTLAENGVGKFDDISDAALDGIRDLGCTHIWLTGVLRQATSTDYSKIGLPADDPDLLKGLAGSPYAIKDYFDVCPDYANDPAKRLIEFKALLDRIHAHGLKAIIDLVPNHVARSYASTIHPEWSFGLKDDKTKFFDPRNNFFYLRPNDPGGGPPLKLPTCKDGQPISPTCKVLGGCDGLFAPEKIHGRVTGNNADTWAPAISDWYETVKLNYGVDFTHPNDHSHVVAPPVPDTWTKMDRIIAYWQAMGVDGFRCDMSHMVPAEFWAWAITRARARQPDVWFMGEAYNNDPAKLPPADPLAATLGNVMYSLLNSGFNAVYDDPTYKALKGIYDGPRWANDIDAAATPDFIYQNSLRYAENHDEVRLAGKNNWGSIGMEVGRPVAAILYGIGRGPVMIYNGQEVGEPADGAEGFGGDDARTTIFDYWSMPELVKWVDGHKYDGALLSKEQKSLRYYYAKLLNLVGEPGFRFGGFRPLNPANNRTARFGAIEGDPASGHWMYAFLRYDSRSQQRWLVVANLHRSTTFTEVHLHIPADAVRWLELPSQSPLTFTDHLGSGVAVMAKPGDLPANGVVIPKIPPLSAMYFAITQSQ